MEISRRDFLNLAAALATVALVEQPVSALASHTAPTLPNSKEDKVANTARAYVGSRSYNGWCLKLCNDIYAQAGYPFKRYSTAYQAYLAMKRKVQSKDKKGALMFWDTRVNPSGHVAIYIGDNKVVTSRTGWRSYVTPTSVSIVSRSDMVSKIPGFLGYCHIGDAITFR